MAKRRAPQGKGRRQASVARGRRQAKFLKLSFSPRRTKSQKSWLPTLAGSWTLSHERKLDLVGILLVAAGLLSVVSMVTPGRGWSGAWRDLLLDGFGWGVPVIPLVLVAVGLRLLLRSIDRLPRISAERLIGAALLYTALLAVLQASLGPRAVSEGLAAGLEGRGGGVVGAALLSALIAAVGVGGAVVILLAWAMVGLTLTAGLSVPELVERALQVLRVANKRLSPAPPAASRPSPASNMETPRPAVDKEIAPPVMPAEPALRPLSQVSRNFAESVMVAPKASAWVLPELTTVLDRGSEATADEAFDRECARMIEETLSSFGAPARVVEINRGPTITQFGVEPDFVEGRGGKRTKVKVSKISALADDLALALAASSIRVEAPVPGKGYVGIEVPNPQISLVSLRDVMESEGFRKIQSTLRLGLGRDVSGRPIAADLGAMPHLLIAGTTGSGKSVCVNAIVACLLLQNTPDDLKFVMVDPKRVELTFYNGIPHLLAPVVVELERVVPALQWVSREMDVRYRTFSKEGERNIYDYNSRQRLANQKPMPFVAVVIDELADLMMLAPDETERVITRLAQLARATGIHLIIATQRPSVDVVTGLIKANFPARIAFAVASSIDSRVILDQPGAERLLGRGDMLFQSPDAAAPIRMQGAYVSETELGRLINHWKNLASIAQGSSPEMPLPAQALPAGVPLTQGALWDEMASAGDDGDPLYDEAVKTVREMRRASTSLLQRRMRIGYTRAARLMDRLEEDGIIGPAKEGSQAREVLDYGELASADRD